MSPIALCLAVPFFPYVYMYAGTVRGTANLYFGDGSLRLYPSISWLIFWWYFPCGVTTGLGCPSISNCAATARSDTWTVWARTSRFLGETPPERTCCANKTNTSIRSGWESVLSLVSMPWKLKWRNLPQADQKRVLSLRVDATIPKSIADWAVRKRFLM